MLLGASLKLEGRFQLQTKTAGPVGMLLVDFDAPSNLRALARFDAAALAALPASAGAGALLGDGYLAFTVDPGGDLSRYQGVVALEGQDLQEAAHAYFDRSEQIPTLVRLAVGQSVTPGGVEWRAGGLLTQFLPDSPERLRRADLDPGDAPPGAALDETPEDDEWVEAKSRAATTEDHELIDPALSSERLLFRLFNERGVKVFEPKTLADACRCSAERIDEMLQSFSAEERSAMVGDDGMIGVTCEFCSTKRIFDHTPIGTPATATFVAALVRGSRAARRARRRGGRDGRRVGLGAKGETLREAARFVAARRALCSGGA